MGSALCNGIIGEQTIVWRCPKCDKRRRTKMYERYDSVILECSQGHQWITGYGLHYAGRKHKKKSK